MTEGTVTAVSVALVTRRLTPDVERLAARLIALGCGEGCEVLVFAEDDAVTAPAPREPLSGGAQLVRLPHGRGLGYNRNRAIDLSRGETIVFVDDDCSPADDWFGQLLAPLGDPDVAAVMGNVHIPPSTFLGDSISALGFPGGGSAGFAVMFGVDERGFTDHLSTLNCAIRRRVLDEVGGFDETMTFGAEDGELSYRIRQAGYRIKFQPTAVVDHAARTGLGEFTRWFFRRGRAAYQFSRRAKAGAVIGRRLRSYKTIVRQHGRDPKVVAIVPLLIASVVLQEAGFAWEWAFGRDNARMPG